jgi:hypothetical protein
MLRVVCAIAITALAGCWFWWLEEERLCEGFEQKASPAALTFCVPLSPFVAIGIVFFSGAAIIWMVLRKRRI